MSASKSFVKRSFTNGLVACPTGAEGRAVGLALGAGSLVLNADPAGIASAVDGVVFAVGYIAAHTGVAVRALFIAHVHSPLHLVSKIVSANRLVLYGG